MARSITTTVEPPVAYRSTGEACRGSKRKEEAFRSQIDPLTSSDREFQAGDGELLSVKTITYESLNHIVRLINGISALLLAILPGKTSILEGIHGWELRPTFRGPRFPRWMENGVSSFNQFIHELSVDSDTSSSVEYSSGDEDSDGNIHPASPSSQSSRRSTFPSNTERFQPSPLGTTKRVHSLKDHFIQRTTDRRRGVIEDLHLAIEIFIEGIFDIVHKAAHSVLSPSETFKALFGQLSSHNSGPGGTARDFDATVSTATLGDDDPTATETNTTFHQSLNTDARTCRDVITELGYPYEATPVVTADGYVLLLERIPRRDSRKVVYLQHGILDSSMGITPSRIWDQFIRMVAAFFFTGIICFFKPEWQEQPLKFWVLELAGYMMQEGEDVKQEGQEAAGHTLLRWVSNGVVGSPAFAAFDQGYDVFLGNFRGLVSREHVDKNISSRQYWHYSINEHGTEDIPAMLEKIHEVKVSELKSNQPAGEEEEINDDQPYKLCAVCHSLGGAAILMYWRSTFFLLLAPIMTPLVPGLYIPTRFFRMLLNKLARDFHNYPAVGGLVQTLMSYVVGGDSSNWIGVIGLPHYNMNDMPGVSLLVVLHLAQMKRARKFIMFDYGSEAANMDVYGSPEPFDLGEYYRLIDVPVDLVAGRKDKVIRPTMVRKHYKLMRDSDVEVSYNEFEYAHLDFTFSHREELLAYVMSRLRLVEPPKRQQSRQKSVRLRKKNAQETTN
ncbi:alpha/beta-Hydrolases superfamily protein [Actinidia rufa]|uniref:Alpha/beta-Hydrolases superfamily protein n=1 Tax=Actinidia rufa TaxID=165716 RepID=A0A7J0GN70_9ERIC|nr:alpha/beta-Hydrolases superfamily protein [Actinidia rufa]